MMLVANGDAELLVFLNYLSVEIADAWLVLKKMFEHYSL